jgi:hypothetical protein
VPDVSELLTTAAPVPDVSEFADDENVSVQDRAEVQSMESPATSSSGGDLPAVRDILQEILELGRVPKELKKPKTECDVAEYRLAVRMRGHDLRSRAEKELQARFF